MLIATIIPRKNTILQIQLSQIPTRIEFGGIQNNLLFLLNHGFNHFTTYMCNTFIRIDNYSFLFIQLYCVTLKQFNIHS